MLHNAAAARCASGARPAPCPRSRATPTATSCCSCMRDAATLFCDYGHLPIRAGDYIVLPRGTMWRIELREPTPTAADRGDQRLATGCRTRAWSAPHAIFDPAMLDTPRDRRRPSARSSTDGRGTWRVEIKRARRGLDRDLSLQSAGRGRLARRPGAGAAQRRATSARSMSHRYHLPPSAHTTFVADRFVVCTFVPRPFETDPGALKVPFFHNNDDYDEVIFYHAGDFFSRDNIEPGMVTLHPGGFTHGPHPKALQSMLTGEEARDRRICGDDRHARRARDLADAGGGREPGLRRQLASRPSRARRGVGRHEARHPAGTAAATARWSSSSARPHALRAPAPASRRRCRPRSTTGPRSSPCSARSPIAWSSTTRSAPSPSIPAQCAAPLPRAYQWVDG